MYLFGLGNQSILKEISPDYSLERLMPKLKLQYLGHLIRRTDSFEKTLMLGRLRQEKGVTEDEMVGWHHQLNEHEFEQALRVGDGQGGLVCCSPWGRKESHTTEQLNWTDFGAFLGLSWGMWDLSVVACRFYFPATAKSLQSYPTVCDPIDGSPPGSPIPGILQARTLEWVAISFSFYLPDQGSNLAPLHWKSRVLSSRPLRKFKNLCKLFKVCWRCIEPASMMERYQSMSLKIRNAIGRTAVTGGLCQCHKTNKTRKTNTKRKKGNQCLSANDTLIHVKNPFKPKDFFKLVDKWDQQIKFNNALCKSFTSGSLGRVCQCRRPRFDPWLGKIPWRRKWQPTPIFSPG